MDGKEDAPVPAAHLAEAVVEWHWKQGKFFPCRWQTSSFIILVWGSS